MEVPFDLHRYIIGQKGSGIRKMMDEFEVKRLCRSSPWRPGAGRARRAPACSMSRALPPTLPAPRPSCVPMDALCSRPASVSMQVNIHVPAPELQSDIIAITGLAANLDRAKAGLLERVKELQAEQEDRVRAGRPGAEPLSTQAAPQPGGRVAETVPADPASQPRVPRAGSSYWGWCWGPGALLRRQEQLAFVSLSVSYINMKTFASLPERVQLGRPGGQCQKRPPACAHGPGKAPPAPWVLSPC